MKRIPGGHLIGTGAVLTLLGGCAGTSVDGQWTDPAMTGRTLREQRVLVSCRAPDQALARTCESRLADELTEAGAQPVRPAAPIDAQGGNEALARAARAAGAGTALAATMSIAGVSRPTAFGLGFGGPVGTPQAGYGPPGMGPALGAVRPPVAYALTPVLVDAASARDLWSARTLGPPDTDPAAQAAALAHASVRQMREAGLFERR